MSSNKVKPKAEKPSQDEQSVIIDSLEAKGIPLVILNTVYNIGDTREESCEKLRAYLRGLPKREGG